MKTKKRDHRYTDDIAREYELITLAYPDFEAFQQKMVEGITFETTESARDEPFHMLEIGTGDGFATAKLLDALTHSGIGGLITTIDINEEMLRKAQALVRNHAGSTHIRFREADALAFLQDSPDDSFDVVATSFTLHNFEHSYRAEVERHLYRVLRPKGLYTNADKYAPSGQDQFDALAHHVDQFFSAFVPQGKIELLRKWVVHNISDQSPRHVMFAEDAIARLGALGFRQVRIEHRAHMQAVLRAVKG